jgi:hypothetical protein
MAFMRLPRSRQVQILNGISANEELWFDIVSALLTEL